MNIMQESYFLDNIFNQILLYSKTEYAWTSQKKYLVYALVTYIM